MNAHPVRSLIVGDPTDPHVLAVTDLLPPQGCVVIDAATVGQMARQVDLHGAELLDLAGRRCRTDAQLGPVNGWIRRLAPAGWDDGTVLGSRQAAVLASRLGLLAAVIRDPAVSWVSRIDAVFAAEGKLTQYRAAATLGIRVADTVAATHHDAVAGLGEPFVLKPIGPGGFRDAEGQQHVVYTRTGRIQDLDGLDLAAAPFLAQRLIPAAEHFRIVTVADNAWTAALTATDRPVDWRQDLTAHDAFQPRPAPAGVERQAVALAQSLSCGYTSQDWILDEHGQATFIDLNPAGQWLFLPEPVASQVTHALAARLTDGARA